MKKYSTVPTSPYFRIGDGLNRENQGDAKVGMLSEVDMSSAERLRRQIETETGVRPSYTALVVKAVSLALRRHPHANRIPVGYFRWRIAQLHDVDMSVAVEQDIPGMEQAVYVDTIRNSDEKDLTAITRELLAMTKATPETNERLGAFKWIVEKLPSWLAIRVASLPRWFAGMWVKHRGGAALISSPAKYGVDIMVGAWPWPLGFSFGLVKDRPVAVEGKVEVRPTMTFTMSFDRRLMGGAPAARFFATILAYLQDAEEDLRKTGAMITPSEEYEGDVRANRRRAKTVSSVVNSDLGGKVEQLTTTGTEPKPS